MDDAAADPAPDAAAELDLGRLRFGLLALVVGVVCDLLDVQIGGIDVVHDGLAVVAYLAVAWALAQPAARAYGAPTWALWIWAAAALVGEALPWLPLATPAALIVAVSIVQALGFVAVAVAMGAICAGRGLSSSERWRRVTIELVLLFLLPLLVALGLGLAAGAGLPLRVVADDGAGWLARAGELAFVALSVLAFVDVILASLTTARSAARRI